MSGSSLLQGLPNLISVGRLLLVPVAVGMISAQQWKPAFAIFAIAGVSDGIDGFLARRFSLRTELGAYLDPLADKALLMSIYVTLAIEGVLPGAMAILVVSRDLMIVGAIMISWVLAKPVEIRPLIISKINTAGQIVLAALVLGAKAFGAGLDGWLAVAIVIVAALTLASMVAYLTQWLKHMSG